jgi:hypothetical protein
MSDTASSIVRRTIVSDIMKLHFDELISGTFEVDDPNRALDYVLRSRRVTRDKEKAICFYYVFKKLRSMGAVPSYPDPKSGCTPKKIHSLEDFIEYNRNSIFSFISCLEELVKGDMYA